ncbi:kinase-like domain-containing protein [Dimargaris cristalligena]|uniref:non-specific serine/threonine protein kinase n=1 Tax=Dimargaris cristalligena TaxID=215637 RepID=A0A4Q0A1E2_9FUNG|nr:kinase-like domain-containing protein [Dimargaris cristalligena]|eukprot:RKP39854.1 kinase-like domain-containing protein [Dimargaris cristalligena]
MAELIQQGAEAKVFALSFYGRDAIAKERFPKTYRHPILDKKLTARRVVQEARCLFRCQQAGIDTPTVYFIDTNLNTIYMERIEGRTVKSFLIEHSGNPALVDDLAHKIGKALAALHGINIIHGDLTTSNLFIRDSNQSLVLIDFGLSYHSSLIEDKAVDLYVLERAFLSTHPNSEVMFEKIVQVYTKKSRDGKQIFAKLEDVTVKEPCHK